MLRCLACRLRFRSLVAILILLSVPLATPTALAAEDCASTPQQLVQYLNKAETQTSPYKIKVIAGNYHLSGSKSNWNPTATTTIEGGYSDCSNRESVDAGSTTIDASSLPQGFGLSPSLEGDLNINGLTFSGGTINTVFAVGGNLNISHARFTATRPILSATNGTMSLEEILVDHVPAGASSQCSVLAQIFGDNTLQWKFVTIQTGNGDDVCIESESSGAQHTTAKIYNSIFWPGNFRMDASEWHSGDVLDVKMFNSIFGQAVVSHGTFSETNSLHVDPLWVNPGAGDFRLQTSPNPMSPGINTGAGAAEIPGGISASDTDIAGNPRIVGSAPDMGAYESTVDDSAVFAVTNATDCSTPLDQPSCGSLRDAIARATASTSTAPSKTIKFWIIGAGNQPVCPAVIQVNSNLPNITTKLTIDGYSQGAINQINPPLSWPNTDPYIFNANLCVAIVGPGTGVGLRVPSGSTGSLTLRGVGLGNFAQGVMLLGGANHQIAGNQFGGWLGNVNLQGFTTVAVNVDPNGQPSGALIVGGNNVADKNVILGATSWGGIPSEAIRVGFDVVSNPDACQILGNLVGILPDGTNAPGLNDYGIVLEGDGCAINGNWIAGNHDGALWVLGQHFVVQSNVIGLAPRSWARQNNGGFGIRVEGSNNIIGAAADDFVLPPLFNLGHANYIADTLDSGILVAAPGTSNTLRQNIVMNTGIGTGGLAIDLGPDGPTANDWADADTGVNNLQNFPQLHGFSWVSPPQPGVPSPATLKGALMTQPGQYNVDVYLGKGCDIGRRGHPELLIGRYTADVSDATALTPLEIPVNIIPDYFDPSLAALSLSATRVSDGNTSEMGTCLSIDTLFEDGFEF